MPQINYAKIQQTLITHFVDLLVYLYGFNRIFIMI